MKYLTFPCAEQRYFLEVVKPKHISKLPTRASHWLGGDLATLVGHFLAPRLVKIVKTARKLLLLHETFCCDKEAFSRPRAGWECESWCRNLVFYLPSYLLPW